jgi:predicted MFS family arabinose efflux permease
MAEPGCRSAIILIAVVALVGSPFIGLVPALVIEGLHVHKPAAGTAVLVTAQGIGAVVGALALAPMAVALGRRRLLVRALFAFPIALVCYGLAPSLWSAALAILVVGGTYIGVLSGLNTVVQLRAPEEARGRVLSLYMMALGTIYPIGLVVEGAIARSAGIEQVTVAAGLLLVGVMAALALFRHGVFEALDDPPTAGTPAPAPAPAPAVGTAQPADLP